MISFRRNNSDLTPKRQHADIKTSIFCLRFILRLFAGYRAFLTLQPKAHPKSITTHRKILQDCIEKPFMATEFSDIMSFE